MAHNIQTELCKTFLWRNSSGDNTITTFKNSRMHKDGRMHKDVRMHKDSV